AGLSFTGFGDSTTRLDVFQSLTASGKFGENRVDGRGPDKRFRLFVPDCQEFVNGGDQFVNAVKGSAANAFVGQLTKPALYQVQPTATGGHVVQDKAGI